MGWGGGGGRLSVNLNKLQCPLSLFWKCFYQSCVLIIHCQQSILVNHNIPYSCPHLKNVPVDFKSQESKFNLRAKGPSAIPSGGSRV